MIHYEPVLLSNYPCARTGRNLCQDGQYITGRHTVLFSKAPSKEL